MYFQPAIIALLLAAGLAVLLLAGAAPYAAQILRRWDLRSGSEGQLRLERRTYLLSTLAAFVFAMQPAALLLFVFNADQLSAMFVGAMCAVGTLNVNGFGFPSLYAQIALFFAAAVWLAINHVDTRARNYPLIRVKYALLLLLLPLAMLSFWLQFRYFGGLRANVITSCCGSLFSGETKTLASEVSALSPQQGIFLFYGALTAGFSLALWHGRCGSRLSGYATAVAGAAAFAAALAGIIAFLSLYIYEHPHHHCPFCILKPEYEYRGYALYLPLFIATGCALAAGAVQAFARRPGLEQVIPAFSRRMAGIAAGGFAVFALVASVFLYASRLILIE
jgi:hypothetical protein